MRICHPSQLNARVQTTRPPRISTTTFIPSTRHIYVPRPVQYRTSLCLASSSSVCRLVCDFCSSGREFASSFFQIPPRGGHPCSSLTVPTAKSVVDFHHQVVVHAAHNRVGGCPPVGGNRPLTPPYVPFGIRRFPRLRSVYRPIVGTEVLEASPLQ